MSTKDEFILKPISEEKANELLGMTAKELDELCETFENGTWDATGFSAPKVGRPPLFLQPMKPLTVKVSEKILDAIDKAAAKSKISRSAFIRNAISNELDRSA